MSRWLAMVVAVVGFGLTDVADAPAYLGCKGGCANSAAPTDGVASGDWSIGYEIDFAYAAVKPTGGQTAPPPATRPGPVLPPVKRPPAPPAAPPRLHVLLLVDDTNKDSGPTNKAGAALLEKAVRSGIPEDRLGKVETISGAALTPDRVRTRIIALGARPQDVIIGFYSGAAEYDEATRAYTLTPASGGRFPRSDLRDWLLARGTALTVLLTDAPAYRVVPEMLPALPPQTGPADLSRLLFGNRGVVDLHAASPGEISFPRDGEGGLFTLAVVDALRDVKAEGDVAWPPLVNRVKTTTDRLYVEYRRAVLTSNKVSAEDKRAYREQNHQTPSVLTPLDRVKTVPIPAGPAPVISTLPAEIVVRVPSDAKVFVEDRSTKLTGAERYFETAELQPGKTYTYEIRADLNRDGKVVSQTKRVAVRAGEKVAVTFGGE
jgi:uncharacterized protein (TIGR03000 family)